MLDFIMSCLCYGSLGAVVIIIVYSALTVSSDIDDEEGADYE